jgi:hypothetical protein
MVKTLLDAVRGFAARYRNEGRRVAVAAALGALAGGGCDWLWRGEWGGGVNPLGWSSYARSDFFESIQVGAVAGGLIGLVMATRRRRRQT